MKPDIIIEFLFHSGLLTAPSGNPFDYVTFKDDGDGKFSILEWKFPEPQVDLKKADESTEFQDYVLNRDKILADKELAKSLENPALKIVLEKNEALTKQVNELIKLLQTSKDIAEINVEAGKLDPLPEKVASAEISVVK